MARPRKYPLPEAEAAVDSQSEVAEEKIEEPKKLTNGTVAQALMDLRDHKRRIETAISSLENL